MSDFKTIFKSCFEPLYGLPAWGVSPGHGSFLTMEFGDQLDSVRDKDRGEWHLWLYCCDWHVYDNGRLVGDASLKSSLKTGIVRAAKYLEGKKLVSASMTEYGRSLTLDFEQGGQLVTQPYDKDTEQWLFFEPHGNSLVVRDDRTFAYGPSNVAEDKWLPMFKSREVPLEEMKDLAFSPDSHLEMEFSDRQKRVTLAIEGHTLCFSSWEALFVRQFDNDVNAWRLHGPEILRDLCEFAIVGSIVYLRGFAKQSGQWTEWQITNATMHGEVLY